jgi:hypothetical protein
MLIGRHNGQPPTLELWFVPNAHAIPSVRLRGETPIALVTETEWSHLSRDKPKIRVVGGYYEARPVPPEPESPNP